MEWVLFVVNLAKRSSTLAGSMYEGRGAGQLRLYTRPATTSSSSNCDEYWT